MTVGLAFLCAVCTLLYYDLFYFEVKLCGFSNSTCGKHLDVVWDIEGQNVNFYQSYLIFLKDALFIGFYLFCGVYETTHSKVDETD